MKRIFIIGFPRSGTTLLQSLLGTADNVMSLPESHFFSSYYACPLDRFPLPPLVADRLYFPRLWGDKKYYKQFVFDTDLIPESAKHEAESLKPQTFIQLLDNTAESCNQTTWVEKTPMHIRRIPAIQRHIPNAVFIHIIRRFTPVLNSWRRALKNNPDTVFALSESIIFRHWKRDLMRTAYWLRRNSSQHTVIKYADLCQNTDESIKSIFSFCGLNNSNKKWQDFSNVASKLIAPFEHWKINNTQQAIEARPEDTELDIYPNSESLYIAACSKS